jgi:DNA mismatch repair protein MutL
MIGSGSVLSAGSATPLPVPQSSASRRPVCILPEEVASRIAAGEVVERPASVVKELAENALDAGAKTVHVELEGGGRECVRVTDDGCGMGPDDLRLSVLPHATSKLVSVEELERMATLGFRGEALPSIASVSRFTLTSRPRSSGPNEAAAWRIEVCGGEPKRPEPRPAGAATGTTVEVRGLFFNVPARAKFLKGAGSEAAACVDALLRLTLTRPDVAFTLRQGRQELFSFLASAGLRDGAVPLSAFFRRARDVLGRSASEGLLEVDVAGPSDAPAQPATRPLAGDYPGYRLYGLVSPPAITRPNRSNIYLSVNGRPVKDRTLTSALLEGCRHLLPPQRYPIAVLFLELPGSDVDINVHPTKAEVRFRLPGLVYALFHHAMRTACGVAPAATAPATNTNQDPAVAPRDEASASSQKAFDLWPKAAVSTTPTPPVTQYSTLAAQHLHAGRVADEAAVFAAPSPAAISQPYRQPRADTEPATQSPQRAAATNSGQRSGSGVQDFRVLGQAGGAYIVLEDASGVKVIDQHALHERVLFEQLMARAEGRSRGDSQGLLLAESLELTPTQAAVFADESATDVLARLGFEVESFGTRSILVRAVPAVLKSASAGTLVRDVLDALATPASSGGTGPADRSYYRERAAYTLACKGAIKAGERLTHEQMTVLITEYRRTVGAGRYTCPHGRPMAIELSWDQLEHGVGRK